MWNTAEEFLKDMDEALNKPRVEFTLQVSPETYERFKNYLSRSSEVEHSADIREVDGSCPSGTTN